MAKRRRLAPDPKISEAPGGSAAPSPARLTPGLGAGADTGLQGAGIPEPRSFPFGPPIAQVAGAAATHAALDAVTEELRRARAEGRLVQALPLSSIDTGYLVRDRLEASPEELAPLIESLRARGQQTPIEVVEPGPQEPSGRYGLISGWRRLTALARLHAETGDPRFGTVLALLRRPADAAAAYVAMVEENEIRVGLSYYERARIVAKSVEAGVFPTPKLALQGLFGAASRPRRSKIGSFLTIVAALDGALRFPTAIGERSGLALAHALQADAGLAGRLAMALALATPASADAEMAVLKAVQNDAVAKEHAGIGRAADGIGMPRAAPALYAAAQQPSEGVYLQDSGTAQQPRLTLWGPQVDAAFCDRLLAWLRDAG